MNIQVLAFINDILQSTIVIFGTSIVLYNLGYSLRDRVTRAFTILVALVVIVYMTELLVTNTAADVYARIWLRVTWFGIVCVPAALFQLANTLLLITGSHLSQRRRYLTLFFYIVSLSFFGLIAFTELVFNGITTTAETAYLAFTGPQNQSDALLWSQIILASFAIYFTSLTAISVWSVWRARSAAVVPSTKRRLNYILVCMVGAPLGVYPYLTHFSELTGIQNTPQTIFFWMILFAGNFLVAFMLSVLTTQIVYFATTASTQRVVRVRLYKFLARVPLAASIVLAAYFFTINTSLFLGLESDTAAAFAVVAVLIVVEWAIHSFKRPLERIFQLDNDPDVRRMQQLSERVVTTRELSDYLETLLAIICNVLQAPSGFIVAYNADGPKLEASVGLNEPTAHEVQMESLHLLAQTHKPSNGPNPSTQEVVLQGDLLAWQNYTIQPLRSESDATLLGIVGVYGENASSDGVTTTGQALFAKLSQQAAVALEDRLLQQQVFAAVEGLLPQITALQQKRSAVTFSGTPAITQAEQPSPVLADPDFSSMVRDALRDYWGGDKLTQSPLLNLKVVQDAVNRNEGNAISALREVLELAIERQRPDGDRRWATPPWVLYNILELKFVRGHKVRDVARRLAMSESDFYRKQRVAIENVAQSISEMEQGQLNNE